MCSFIENKYLKWYFNIIEYRKKFSYDGYTENHHIIPRAMGGTNDRYNLVKLTAREHFICHMLLVRFVTDKAKSKMIFAMFNMSRQSRSQERYAIKSRTYAIIKKQMGEVVSLTLSGIKRSLETKDKISASNLGKKRSEDTCKRMSISQQGRKFSKESIEKRSQSVRGSKRSEETKKKMSIARSLNWKNRISSSIHTTESKLKISQSLLGKSKESITCPHCGKTGGKPSMLRWHFNHCEFVIYI